MWLILNATGPNKSADSSHLVFGLVEFYIQYFQDLRSTCHNRNCAMRLRWCTQQASVTKLITPNARRNSADNEGGDIDIQIAAEVARMLAVAQEDINVCDFIQAPYRRGWFADTYRPITFELPPSTDALWTTALFF